MSEKIYIEENKCYKIDCSKALWSTDKIHDDYHTAGASTLCDVDLIIENEDRLILMEYKNANIKESAHPENFQPSSDKKINNVVKKYYDSLHYLSLHEKSKNKSYVYILEYPNGDATSRRMLRNKLKTLLPFQLQNNEDKPDALISSVDVLSIDEWNSNDTYKEFPISAIGVKS